MLSLTINNSEINNRWNMQAKIVAKTIKTCKILHEADCILTWNNVQGLYTEQYQ